MSSVCLHHHIYHDTHKHSNAQIQTLSDQLLQLRKQVSELANTVKATTAHNHINPSPSSGDTNVGQSPASSSQREGLVPKEPQFVGPTRSAFGIIIGERSLTRMGIPTYDPLPPSGAQSPVAGVVAGDCVDYWQTLTVAELVRLLTVFQEEVESVYPFLNIGEQAARGEQMLRVLRNEQLACDDVGFTPKDVEIVKVAMATAIVLETHGKKELSSMIVQSVENNVSVIARPEVDLKEIQLITMLVCIHARLYFNITNTARAYTTFTATRNSSPGAPLAWRRGKPSRWACIARRACWTTLRTSRTAVWPRECFGASTCWTAAGVSAPASLSL